MPHEEPHNHEHTHRCLHDELKRDVPTTVTPQSYTVPLVLRQEGTAHGRGLAVSHTFPPEGTHDAYRQPFRVFVDTSRLEADSHSCWSAFDSVKITEYGKSKKCSWSDVITEEKKTLIQTKVIPMAVGFITKALSVHRVNGPLRLGSITCGFEGGAVVPQWMREEGIPDTDFVVFLTMRPIDSPDTIAYGGHCEVDQTGRPIAAHFNWAPAQLPQADTELMEHYLSRIALHELTHALVFTPELISHFPAESLTSEPPGAVDGALGWDYYQQGYYGSGITYLPSPAGSRAHVSTRKVARAVQRHFGCPHLRGAQLEDGGGAGTSNSHWEMRLFRDEYMVGSSSPSYRTFSVVTAALFADSGWYGVDESVVEPQHWGHHKGCDFVEKSCGEWNHPGYLCRGGGELACSYDRRSQAYCELTHHDNLPPHQRYFGESSTLGGFSELLDYCPVYRAYSNGGCTQKGNFYDWMPNGGQERCTHCRCFDSTAMGWRSEPSCFRIRCLSSNELEVHVGGSWHRCEAGGGTINLAPYKDDSGGTVTCPAAAELCDQDTDLWPILTSIEPTGGSASGGIQLTLRGQHLDHLEPPVQLLFGTAEGAETAALDLLLVNATFASARSAFYARVVPHTRLANGVCRDGVLTRSCTIVRFLARCSRDDPSTSGCHLSCESGRYTHRRVGAHGVPLWRLSVRPGHATILRDPRHLRRPRLRRVLRWPCSCARRLPQVGRLARDARLATARSACPRGAPQDGERASHRRRARDHWRCACRRRCDECRARGPARCGRQRGRQQQQRGQGGGARDGVTQRFQRVGST